MTPVLVELQNLRAKAEALIEVGIAKSGRRVQRFRSHIDRFPREGLIKAAKEANLEGLLEFRSGNSSPRCASPSKASTRSSNGRAQLSFLERFFNQQAFIQLSLQQLNTLRHRKSPKSASKASPGLDLESFFESYFVKSSMRVVVMGLLKSGRAPFVNNLLDSRLVSHRPQRKPRSRSPASATGKIHSSGPRVRVRKSEEREEYCSFETVKELAKMVRVSIDPRRAPTDGGEFELD